MDVQLRSANGTNPRRLCVSQVTRLEYVRREAKGTYIQGTLANCGQAGARHWLFSTQPKGHVLFRAIFDIREDVSIRVLDKDDVRGTGIRHSP